MKKVNMSNLQTAFETELQKTCQNHWTRLGAKFGQVQTLNDLHKSCHKDVPISLRVLETGKVDLTIKFKISHADLGLGYRGQIVTRIWIQKFNKQGKLVSRPVILTSQSIYSIYND